MEDALGRSKAKIICDAICGIVMLLCIITYVVIGICTNIWHPYWIIIVAGGVFCGILGIVGNTMSSLKEIKQKDENNK